MTIISAILYFLTAHPFWSWPVLVIVGVALALAMVRWTKKKRWYGLILAFFLFGQVNIFTAHIFNAWFLADFGTDGTGVITHSEETASQLNNQNISAYDAVLRTADGQDVTASFDDMSASIYPVTNAILIPPEGERFAIRYIPGFPRNFVIMRALSPYGMKQQLAEDREPVEKAANQLAASPNNPAFQTEYRKALAAFTAKHGKEASPGAPAGLKWVEDLAPVEKAAHQLAADPGNSALREAYRKAMTTFIAMHGKDAPAAMIQGFQQTLDALGER